MSQKTDDFPSYEPKFERVDTPTEPLSIRAAKREKQREALSHTNSTASVRRAWGKAIEIHVKWFLKSGHINRTPKDEWQRRLLKTKIGTKVASTAVALWVFDLIQQGGQYPMTAYEETARHFSLSVKQVRDCFSQHREELERHRFLFTLQ